MLRKSVDYCTDAVSFKCCNWTSIKTLHAKNLFCEIFFLLYTKFFVSFTFEHFFTTKSYQRKKSKSMKLTWNRNRNISVFGRVALDVKVWLAKMLFGIYVPARKNAQKIRFEKRFRGILNHKVMWKTLNRYLHTLEIITL